MSAPAMAEAASSIATHDVRGDLHKVDLPALVLVGSKDRLTPPVHARAITRLIPGADLEVVSDIGHQVMQEAPQSVVDAVDRVLRSGNSS